MDDLVRRTLALGGTAAFDADGTLWADDVGESFLRLLSAEGRVSPHAWADYETLHARDTRAAYAFAVTCMEGLAESEVAELSGEFFAKYFAPRILAPSRRLLGSLLEAGVRVAIISASNRWVVEAGARELGVELFSGIEVEVVDGKLSGRLRDPLPTGAGKVERARMLLGGPPAMAAGNGENDIPLLESAKLPLVIAPVGPPTRLARLAGERGWLTLEVEHPCPLAPLP